MKGVEIMRLSSSLLLAALALPLAVTAVNAQTADFLSGDAVVSVPIVRGAPFSADAIVTTRMTLFDGTKIERSVKAKYARDNEGRVRREQTILGLESVDPSGNVPSIVTIVDPVAGVIYTIVSGTKVAQRMAIPTGQVQPPATAARPDQSLGTKQIEGIAAVGHETKTVIPVGQVGNDRPIEIVDERWEATDLKVLLASRHHDPRSGDVEYQLQNISRGEPAKDLFQVPAGYKIVDIPPRQ
jgi:hypothetical protein